ncbi:hypothetical protein SIPHO054v2_p0017 [Vibrio phage 103E44.1]|nr:hypothetical protein SIPHO054v2_p0017 [Vibrio phage 103E44.1]QZI87873.1 hypothetical protein SIPHO055v2_p0017 [Vibrio phage 104E43.1]
MSNCNDYPTSDDAKRFKNNAGSVNEFVTSDSDTFVDQDGGEHITIQGIENNAENLGDAIADSAETLLTEIDTAASTQRDQFNATFQAQFAYGKIGNISDYVGDTLIEADKLNSYQYPDDSENWYGPIQSQTFPITIPADPTVPGSGWALVNAATQEWVSDNFSNPNLLSNHNFLKQSPDNITHPSSTPTDYVAGTQIFSGVFVGSDVVGLTYVNGRVKWTNPTGTIYLSVSNSNGLEYITEFTASVADFDGKPRTRGVSFSLVGDEYRVMVGIDVLEDESANETLLGSVKFEQGSVATGHQTQNNKGQTFTFNTVAEMVSGGATVGSQVQWLGYYEASDGGSNWGIVKSGAHTEDGGSIFSIDANTYIEANLKGKSVSVLKFGAGHSSTATAGINNDLTIFQKASDYVGTVKKGGKVKVPNPTHVDYYSFIDNFGTGVNQRGWLIRNDGITVEFESSSTIIKTLNNNQMRCITVAYDTDSLPAQRVRNIEIIGGTLDGNNDSPTAVTDENSHGIDVRFATNVRIKGVNIKKFRGDGISLAYGVSNVRVKSVDVDGNRANALAGFRQGVAVLSGEDIKITSLTTSGTITGIDLELDDNQIVNGFNYIRGVKINVAKISNTSAQGISIPTGLVTSSVDISDIQIDNVELKGIDETLINIDVNSSAGTASRVQISNITSDGSNTFKGISMTGVVKSHVNTANLGTNADNVMQIGARCDQISIDGVTGVTSGVGKSAIKLIENTSNVRLSVTLGSTNNVVSREGVGLDIDGAWEVTSEGGRYVGKINGFTSQGSGVSGNDTRCKITKTGGVFEATGVGNAAAVVQDDNRDYISTGTTFRSPAGTTDVIVVAANVIGSPRLNAPNIEIGGAPQLDSRKAIDDQSSIKAIIIDSQPWFNTSAELNDINSYANNVGKEFFIQVWNSTLGKPVYALQGTNVGVWVDATGSVVNTPS